MVSVWSSVVGNVPPRGALLEELRSRTGCLYRIELRLAGADPRIALRAPDKPSTAELDAIASKLQAMDARSKGGSWTQTYLGLIQRHPETRAPDLAAGCGMATAPFEARVRRLEELGLAESMGVGGRLSPRGRVVWNHLRP